MTAVPPRPPLIGRGPRVRSKARAWIWSPGWSLRLSLDLADMYRPVVRSLTQGLSGHCEVEVLSGDRAVAAERMSGGDLFIIVGQDQWENIPREKIRQAGARIIMYQTEPLRSPLPDSLTRRIAGGIDEVWDYSHANLAHLSPPARASGVRLRYVPPGCAPSLDLGSPWAAPTRAPIVFLGLIYGNRPAALSRLRAAGLPLEIVRDAFTVNAQVALFGRRTIFLNLHKHSGDCTQPVEMLRMSLLLNNRSIVLSEMSDPEDMHDLASLVHFHPLDRITEAYREISADPCLDEKLERTHLLFKKRFDMSRVFARAGLQDLFDEHSASQ